MPTSWVGPRIAQSVGVPASTASRSESSPSHRPSKPAARAAAGDPTMPTTCIPASGWMANVRTTSKTRWSEPTTRTRWKSRPRWRRTRSHERYTERQTTSKSHEAAPATAADTSVIGEPGTRSRISAPTNRTVASRVSLASSSHRTAMTRSSHSPSTYMATRPITAAPSEFSTTPSASKRPKAAKTIANAMKISTPSTTTSTTRSRRVRRRRGGREPSPSPAIRRTGPRTPQRTCRTRRCA